MRLKALIIEDEAPAYRRLHGLLSAHHPQLEVVDVVDTIQAAMTWFGENTSPDVIFSDIQLSDGLSFEIYKQVPPPCPIIFTTAYDAYMLEAFRTNGIDYLLKPVNREKLKNSLEKFRKIKHFYGGESPNLRLYEMITELKSHVGAYYRDRFLISKGNAMIPVKASEIACIYAEDKAVLLFTKEGKRYVIPNTIEELETSLDPRLFFRVNRQCIVSADVISKVHNYFNFKLKLELQPDPGIEIIVSRSRSAGFRGWMNGG